MRIGITIGDALHDQVEFVLGLSGFNAGAKDAKNVDPRRAAIVDAISAPHGAVHAQRHPEISSKSRLAAFESARRNTDNGIAVKIYLDGFAHDSAIGAEAVLPERIAQDCFRSPFTFVKVRLTKSAAEDGMNTQHFKVICRSERAVDAHRH